MTDAELLRRFESRRLRAADFDHANHVRVAWLYLQQNPLPEAMILFRDHLKAFATSLGKSELYNETITFIFILLIHDRAREGESWSSFAEQNQDLLDWKNGTVKALYPEEILASPEAKMRFILPGVLRR